MPPVEMPASLSQNTRERGGAGGRSFWAKPPCRDGPVCLVLGVTHPGLQPVTVEPQLIPLLLHLLKLAPQLLDLLLGCSKEGKVSQRSSARVWSLGSVPLG